MKLTTRLATSVALSLGLVATTAGAETFRIATWGAVGSFTDRFITDVAEQVKEATNGSVEFETFAGGVLLPPDGTLGGIVSGVAHVANLTAAYIPSELPVDAVGGDLSFIADDQMALAFAKTETTFFNEQFQEEIAGHDIVFLSGFTVGIFYPICNFNLDSLAGLRGKKVRGSSGAHIEYLKHLAAVQVSVPATEIYTGLQRGSLDCAFGDAPYLTEQFRLMEVAKSVYQIPLGSNANGGYYANKRFWQDRTPEERRAILKAMSRATARSMIEYNDTVEEAWEAAAAAGVAINPPSEADLEEINGYKAQFAESLPQAEMEKRGVEDPTELINEMQASIEKWKELLDGIDRNDLDAVTALLDREVFDKIDVNIYGVN